jgi:hypothetical protein
MALAPDKKNRQARALAVFFYRLTTRLPRQQPAPHFQVADGLEVVDKVRIASTVDSGILARAI